MDRNNANDADEKQWNRRRVLTTTGAVAVTALAGCSGSDAEESESDGESSGDGGGEEQQSESEQTSENGSGEEEDGGEETQNIEDREVGESIEENAGLVIQDHELVVDEGEYSTDITVEGTIENTTDETKDYVQVDVRVYDADGNQRDNYFTNTENLQAGGTWVFEVMILEEADNVEEYDIAVTDSAL